MILFIFVKVTLEYPEVANEEEVAEFVLPDVEVPHHFPPAPPQVMINLEVWFTPESHCLQSVLVGVDVLLGLNLLQVLPLAA